MVEPRLVEPVVRVRFPVAAQISQPESVSSRAVAVWSGYRESKDGAGTQDERKRVLVGESGQEPLSILR